MIIYPLSLIGLVIGVFVFLYFFVYNDKKYPHIINARQNLQSNKFGLKLLNFITAGKDRTSLTRLFILFFAFMLVLNFIVTIFINPQILLTTAQNNPFLIVFIPLFFLWLFNAFKKA